MTFEDRLRQMKGSPEFALREKYYENIKDEVTAFCNLCIRQSKNGYTNANYYLKWWISNNFSSIDSSGDDGYRTHYFNIDAAGYGQDIVLWQEYKIKQQNKDIFLYSLRKRLTETGFENCKIVLNEIRHKGTNQIAYVIELKAKW